MNAFLYDIPSCLMANYHRRAMTPGAVPPEDYIVDPTDTS